MRRQRIHGVKPQIEFLLSFVIALNSKADECNEHKKNIEMRKKNH